MFVTERVASVTDIVVSVGLKRASKPEKTASRPEKPASTLEKVASPVAEGTFAMLVAIFMGGEAERRLLHWECSNGRCPHVEKCGN